MLDLFVVVLRRHVVLAGRRKVLHVVAVVVALAVAVVRHFEGEM